jgi:hypothetical protein
LLWEYAGIINCIRKAKALQIKISGMLDHFSSSSGKLAAMDYSFVSWHRAGGYRDLWMNIDLNMVGGITPLSKSIQADDFSVVPVALLSVLLIGCC